MKDLPERFVALETTVKYVAEKVDSMDLRLAEGIKVWNGSSHDVSWLKRIFFMLAASSITALLTGIAAIVIQLITSK